MEWKFDKDVYVINHWGKPASYEKFPDKDSAMTFCLHKGWAVYKIINAKMDRVIVLKYGYYIDKLK